MIPYHERHSYRPQPIRFMRPSYVGELKELPQTKLATRVVVWDDGTQSVDLGFCTFRRTHEEWGYFVRFPAYRLEEALALLEQAKRDVLR